VKTERSPIDKKDLSRSTKTGIVITLSALLSAAVDDDDCAVTVNPAARLRGLLDDPNALKTKKLTKDGISSATKSPT
jgi:hypothetical protein